MNPSSISIPSSDAVHSHKKLWLGLALVFIVVLLTGIWLFLHRTHLSPSTVAKQPAKVQPAPTPLECTSRLPLDTLVGQTLMMGVTANTMTAEAPIFSRYHIGGAVVMTSPSDPYDGSVARFKSAGGSPGNPLLLSTDEEGGIVQRFATLGVLPSQQTVSNSLSLDDAEALVAQHGKLLKSIGIDMILGPVADVAPVQGTSPLGNRIFSSNPKIVSAYTDAYVKGWQSAGLLPTPKHFPGMGSASANTDYETATTPPLSQLIGRDFVPYQELAGDHTAIMIGNQNVPGWFTGPASLSPTVNRYLRETLGYQNTLVVTDSLSAAAVTAVYSTPKAVVMALTAGNDMALIVGPEAEMTPAESNSIISQTENSITGAVQNGTLTKSQLAASVLRILSAKHVDACSLTPKAD